jgi:hypothetical protein
MALSCLSSCCKDEVLSTVFLSAWCFEKGENFEKKRNLTLNKEKKDIGKPVTLWYTPYYRA